MISSVSHEGENEEQRGEHKQLPMTIKRKKLRAEKTDYRRQDLEEHHGRPSNRKKYKPRPQIVMRQSVVVQFLTFVLTENHHRTLRMLYFPLRMIWNMN